LFLANILAIFCVFSIIITIYIMIFIKMCSFLLFNLLTKLFPSSNTSLSISVNNIDKFSMVEDVPDYVFIDDRNGGKKLIEYMEQTANNYASKMIFVRN